MKKLMIPVMLCLALTISACGKKEESTQPKQSAGEVTKEVKEAVSAIENKVTQERDEFVDTARMELDKLNTQVAKLWEKTKDATLEEKEKLQLQLQKLDEKSKVAEQKLSELKAETSEKWQEFKGSVSEAIEQFKQATKEAGSV